MAGEGPWHSDIIPMSPSLRLVLEYIESISFRLPFYFALDVSNGHIRPTTASLAFH